ncbi:unnamed protein product [[Candida] boidinii]|nr:unnamed protein product [[Candida] boidinii]
MTSASDDEALFDDIYGEDEATTVDASSGAKPEAPVESQESAQMQQPETNTVSQIEAPQTNSVDSYSNSESIGNNVNAYGNGGYDNNNNGGNYNNTENSNQNIYNNNNCNNNQNFDNNNQNLYNNNNNDNNNNQFSNQETNIPKKIEKADISKEDGKMFIGGLNWETTEEGLKEYFIVLMKF